MFITNHGTHVRFSFNYRAEVEVPYERFVVHLDERSCSCRNGKLSTKRPGKREDSDPVREHGGKYKSWTKNRHTSKRNHFFKDYQFLNLRSSNDCSTIGIRRHCGWSSEFGHHRRRRSLKIGGTGANDRPKSVGIQSLPVPMISRIQRIPLSRLPPVVIGFQFQ
ncbi:hypothetical protein Taro_013529 [Colocasia esculenta]|uniref:Uncharacterized protein n=1 Tax=Colocasia esculenta TaxID=4460 RepID=A0A843U6R2_COLES|nr:hypothetical protein [Colocasia esculenta]